MSTVPVREIASIGLIKDIPPPELPAQAWTSANNVRFVDRSIRRAPGFRTFLSSLLTTSPYSFFAAAIKSADDYILYTDNDGNLYRRTVAGTSAEVTAIAHVDTASNLPVTYTMMGENAVINRSNEQPWYLAPAAANAVALTGWTSTHTAAAVRTYKTFLVALNVTKAGVNYPVMVKTSSPSVNGAIPTSWDHTSPSTLATENSLTELETEIVDGLALADDFMIYTSTDVMRMSFIGDDNVFGYRATGIKKGVINQNCIVEVDGKHYVFGFNSLYRHDGVTPEDIGDERINKFVYRYLDRGKAHRCFVTHDERLKTVYFCFFSTDPEAYWPSTGNCNRAVAFNYSNNTAALIDLPNVCGASFANPATIQTWATIAGTWASISGGWNQYAESTLRIPMFCGNPPNTSVGKVWAHDVIGEDAFVAELTLDTTLSAPPLLRKEQSDIDELGATLRDYKNLKGILPQIDSEATFLVRFGERDRIKDTTTWTAQQSFDPEVDDTVDLFVAGRLVSFEITTADTSNDFTFTAYDIDITVTSHK